MSLAVRKRVLRPNVNNRLQSNVQRICRLQRRRKESNFNILLILEKYNSMIVMQKLKCLQDFTSNINVYIALCKQNYKCTTAHVKNMQKRIFVADSEI